MPTSRPLLRDDFYFLLLLQCKSRSRITNLLLFLLILTIHSYILLSPSKISSPVLFFQLRKFNGDKLRMFTTNYVLQNSLFLI